MSETPKKEEQVSPPFIMNAWEAHKKRTGIETGKTPPAMEFMLMQAFYAGFSSGKNVMEAVAKTPTPKMYVTVIEAELDHFLAANGKLTSQLEGMAKT